MRAIAAPVVALIAALEVTATEPARGVSCRCAPRTLEQYVEDAEIVVVGRVRSVRIVDVDGGRIEISIDPQFKPERPFKGSLAGLTLATSASSASCGVDVGVGETWVIFASRQSPAESLARFDTCNGTRRYAVGEGDPQVFPGLENRKIVERLFELTAQPAVSPSADRYHTSPACWRAPRIFHDGPPLPDDRRRVTLERRSGAFPRSVAIVSPNGAYRAWSQTMAATTTAPGGARVLIDNERPDHLAVTLRGALGAPDPRWVNEKILFIRATWGRIAFTDLLIDVESGKVIHEEAAREGSIAFEQFRTACAGRCPCG